MGMTNALQRSGNPVIWCVKWTGGNIFIFISHLLINTEDQILHNMVRAVQILSKWYSNKEKLRRREYTFLLMDFVLGHVSAEV